MNFRFHGEVSTEVAIVSVECLRNNNRRRTRRRRKKKKKSDDTNTPFQKVLRQAKAHPKKV